MEARLFSLLGAQGLPVRNQRVSDWSLWFKGTFQSFNYHGLHTALPSIIVEFKNTLKQMNLLKTNEQGGGGTGTLLVPTTAFLSSITNRGEIDAKGAPQSMAERSSVCMNS